METSGDANRDDTPRRRFATDLETLRNEVVIETFRPSGPGGQRRDKKETAVRLRHLPSGVTVVASERRSQATNLEIAFNRLRAKLARLNRPVKRRVRTKPPVSALQQRLERKRRQSEKKRLRQTLDISSEVDTA